MSKIERVYSLGSMDIPCKYSELDLDISVYLSEQV